MKITELLTEASRPVSFFKSINEPLIAQELLAFHKDQTIPAEVNIIEEPNVDSFSIETLMNGSHDSPFIAKFENNEIVIAHGYKTSPNWAIPAILKYFGGFKLEKLWFFDHSTVKPKREKNSRSKITLISEIVKYFRTKQLFRIPILKAFIKIKRKYRNSDKIDMLNSLKNDLITRGNVGATPEFDYQFKDQISSFDLPTPISIIKEITFLYDHKIPFNDHPKKMEIISKVMEQITKQHERMFDAFMSSNDTYDPYY